MMRALVAVLAGVLATYSVAAAVCQGDCNSDGQVGVNELIVAVNIALGGAAIDECTPVDANGDGEVAIAEIIGAVNAALNGCPPAARVVTLSRAGRIASLDIAAPWTVRASNDLGASIASARCRAGRCLVVHPAPHDMISIVDATDLSLSDPIVLEHGADPRDVALVDDHTAVVSLYNRAEVLEIDLTTRAVTPIDLTVLADDDGLPEALQLASCGRRVFVQLQRLDHATQ